MRIKKPYSVSIADDAYLCLADVESFKTETIGTENAAKFTESLLLDSVALLQEDPLRYRFNTGLAEMGLQIREKLYNNGEYRVLYEVDSNKVYILLILSTRQDIQTALYRYQILR